VPGTLTLVDGTLLSALPLLVQAMGLKHETGSGLVKLRLHTHFEVAKFVPARIDVTPDGGGENDERAVLDRAVEADRTYVFDRGPRIVTRCRQRPGRTRQTDATARCARRSPFRSFPVLSQTQHRPLKTAHIPVHISSLFPSFGGDSPRTVLPLQYSSTRRAGTR